MKSAWGSIIILALVTVFSSFLVWLPFILGLGHGMLTVFANYDGPNYIVIAKTLYQPELIKHTFSLPLPAEYYTAHFPAYPLLIKFFNMFITGTWSMILVTLLTTILSVVTFYLFLKKFHLTNSPLWLSILFLFLPARWLIVRSVGSPEPLFIFGILGSLYFFKSAFDKKDLSADKAGNNLISKHKSVTLDFLLAGLFGALAQLTKTPAILLFFTYLVWIVINSYKTHKIIWKSWPLFIMPLSIALVFLFFQKQTGDFLAYFHSGDNFHLVFPPFQSFIMERSWLGDFWLEDMIYTYLLGALAVVLLFKQKLYDLATFALIFFSATLFISHRDLSRYSLPLMPFALIALAPFLERREFKIAFGVIFVGIYIYTINFIGHNTAPIADWTPYL